MGLRSQRNRKTSPPKITARKAQSISASLGITNHPGPSSNEHAQNPLDDLDDPILDQFMPLLNQPEAPASPIPDAAHHFAQESRDYWNEQARINQKNQWKEIEFQMTATYLELQHRTRNWTSEASYLDLDVECQCPDSQLIMQAVDLIDILGFNSKHHIIFCSCMPKPVRLLHYGFISSSPQSPQTAFSIRLLQFHHQLWNTTVTSSTGFVNGLMSFLNLRSNSNLKPCSYRYRSLIHDRDLRRQFSGSVNMYRSMILCIKKIYNEGMNLSNAELLADRCGRCFGPAINEERPSPQEPHVIVALDGNFQHRHYTRSSKDNPTEEEYPDVFVKPSSMKKHEVIQNLTEAQSKSIKITLNSTAKWLIRRLQKAKAVLQESSSALASLSSKRSSLFPAIRYTHEFLRLQWKVERQSQEKRSHVQEQQKIELGRLLLLEETACTVWAKDADNIEEATARLTEHNQIQKKIEKQRAKIGSETILNDLNVLEQDQILKIWFAKQEVRNQFVAVREQKRPLDVSRQDGKNSSIGYNDKTYLLKSLRDATTKLKNKLEIYHRLLSTYSTTSPHRTQPTSINYLDLLEIDFDHPFWNDGLFTNGREPWAIDADTQHGMRQIAYHDRAIEEIRRLGWEVRRVMRWAITSHRSLSTHLYQLQTHILAEDFHPTDLPLTNHPALSFLGGPGKISAARVIINQKLVRIYNLQADWNSSLGEVLHCTPSQEGDNDLKRTWRNQIQKIQYMYSKERISLNPGVVTILQGVEDAINIDEQAPMDLGGDSEGITNTDGDSTDASSDEDADNEWEDINEAMM
ncbi:hypothetical protein DFH28DRAFT_1178017 [Melampsora americana]|nr:hypothetical protein DFH28DRAFT_1178017 [Melampsora americana]